MSRFVRWTRGACGARFGDSRLRTLGRWRWAARADAEGQHAPARSVLVGLHLIRRSRSGLPRLPGRFSSGQSAVLLPARPARSVLRYARTKICEQRRIAPLNADAGAELRIRDKRIRVPRQRSAEHGDALTNLVQAKRACQALQPHAQNGTTPKSRNTVLDPRSTPSGATRRCPQTSVRAKRSTLRAPARAKQLSRMQRMEPHPSLENRSLSAIDAERSNTTLPTNFGAREAQHASRASARQAVQPHARKHVELTDFGRIRSRSANEAGPTKADRTGACFPRASARAAQRHRPRVRKRESPNRARSAARPPTPAVQPRPRLRPTPRGALDGYWRRMTKVPARY